MTKTHVMLGAETGEKLFDAPLSISKREQLEQQVGVGSVSGALVPAAVCGSEAASLQPACSAVSTPTPLPVLQVLENYFYVPDLGQVPEIDVPSYLPDLPGIADDLMYNADLGPGIAPSAPGAIPELPTFHTEVAEPFKPGERQHS